MRNRHKTSHAFTLVEVLTTVVIIGILLSVLLPALNQVGKRANVVRQRAQFHAIELALEAFRGDTGDYPPSAYQPVQYGEYTASQRLSEAVIGRDGLGFHRDSVYHQNGLGPMNPDDPRIYYPDFQTYLNTIADATEKENKRLENLAARYGPYLELESANAVKLSTIFSGIAMEDTFVLADSFKTVRNTLTGRKTGMPILYYRANRTRTGHSSSHDPLNTYDTEDSYLLLDRLPNQELLDDDWFYRRTQNPNFQNPPRPYRAESFILHSAGPDGVFGTADDVFNFDEGN